jgi:hypothetical protein
MIAGTGLIETADLAIVGGGAAGLAAAIEAGRRLRRMERGLTGHPPTRIVVLEKQDKLGRKILATGNGRCNLTNKHAAPTAYHGGGPGFVSFALTQFDVTSNLDFFYSMGLPCREEAEGRCYPACQQAAAVVDVLRLELERLDVKIHLGWTVASLEQQSGPQPFALTAVDGRQLTAKAVILANGGQASPNLGSDGSGYRLAASLGHHVIQPRPALVQMETAGRRTAGLAGIRVETLLTMRNNSRELWSELGEVLLTEYGLSGIPILQASRMAGDLLASSEGPVTIRLDLLPEFPYPEVLSLIQQRCSMQPSLPAMEVLTGLLHRRIGQYLARECLAQNTHLTCGQLTGKQQQQLARAVKQMDLPVRKVRDFDQAQVTAGGLDCAEFWPERCESRKVPGLFAVGELLDVDGDCGGYNLQWAWSSGRLAGRLAARLVQDGPVKSVLPTKVELP